MRRWLDPLARLALLALAVLPAACSGDEPTAGPGSGAAAYDDDGRFQGATPPPGPQWNVLLVVIDTLRADALSLGAEGGGSMPLLAQRARLGTAFEQAAAPAPWTLPSMTSLLTSRLPSEHGVLGEDGRDVGLASLPTWAEILAATRGYETQAWVAGPWSGGAGRMLEGFESVIARASLQSAPVLVTHWSRSRAAERPYFLLLHTFEAHDPYGAEQHPFPERQDEPAAWAAALERLGAEPSASDLVRGFVLDRTTRDAILTAGESRGLMRRFMHAIGPGFAAQPDQRLADDLRSAYQAGTAWVDGLLERVLTSFEGAGLLKNTILIITSDHGEAFGEHGMLLHGRQLYDELLRVPLVILGPGPFQGGRRVRGSVSLVDLLPTVLDALGLPPPSGCAGRSLLPMLGGGSDGHVCVSEASRTLEQTAGTSEALVQGVRSSRWKWILTYERLTGSVREEAYDLAADPGERTNLLAGGATLDTLALPLDVCSAVERARDRIWGEIRAARLARAPGDGAGPAEVPAERPPPACPPGASR